MNYRILTFSTLVLFFAAMAGFSAAQDSARGEGDLRHYQTEISYPGNYDRDSLYMRRSEKKAYMGHHRPASLNEVTCTQARKSLQQFGFWEGNLKRDGSCGSSLEPAQWVTGNYLNFYLGE